MAKKVKGKKKGTKGKGTPMGVGVSLNPETFIEPQGFADNFDCTFEATRYILYDYPKQDGTRLEEYRTVVRLNIIPDEDSGFPPFSQYYGVGKSKFWLPANVEDDELVAVDAEEWDGEDYDEVAGTHIQPTEELVKILRRKGKVDPETGVPQAELPKNTNYHFLLTKLAEIGFTDWPEDGSVEFFDVMHAHMDRVRGPERDFGDDRGGKKSDDILVITEIYGKAKTGKASASGKGSGKVSGKAKASSGKASGKAAKGKKGKGDDEDAEVKAKLEEIVADILTEKPMSRRKLITKVIQSGKLGNKEKRVALSLLADSSEFMGEDERPWAHDEDDDTFWLSLGDEEDESEEDEEDEEEEGDTDEDEEEGEEDEEEDED